MSTETETKALLKKLDEHHEDWRSTLLGMYKQGASDREVMVELGLSKGAWQLLLGESASLYSDFEELVDLGRLCSYAWWEKQGRTNLMTTKFQTALWTIQMKNRFGWSEKSESSVSNVQLENLNDEELQREIERLQVQFDRGRGKG